MRDEIAKQQLINKSGDQIKKKKELKSND